MEQELPISEEQTYREMMRGIRSIMGWTHVPHMDSSNLSDDNLFAGPKAPVPYKVSMQMPTEEWLYKKFRGQCQGIAPVSPPPTLMVKFLLGTSLIT